MGNSLDILGSGIGTSAASSLEPIISGVSGSLLSTAIGEAASFIPFIGPVIQAITSFIHIGGGCGETCVASSKGEQVFEVAGDDILHTVRNGMLSGTDGVTLLGVIKQQGEAFLAKLIEQGDSKAQDGLTNMDSVLNNLISTTKQYNKATTKLDISTAQSSFISTGNQGWYVESVVSGNAMATQILQAYVQSGISGAQNSDLSGTLDSILNSLSSQLQSAQNGSTGTLNNILGGISGLLGIAQAGGTTTGTKIVSGILGTLGLSTNTANNIASDITTALNDITKTIDTFNTDIIGKLVNPVLESINKAETLQTSLESDLKNGLTGILQIPSQLAGYLTSNEQIAKQTTDLRNENTTSVASNILVPGIGDKIGGNLNSLHDTITQVLGIPEQQVTEFAPITLSEPPVEETFLHDIAQFKQDVNNPTHWYLAPVKALLEAFQYVAYWSASIEPYLELAVQGARAATPIKPLDLGSIVELLHRNLITWAQAITEANKSGIDATRLTSLYTLSDSLLGVKETVDAYYRGIIDQGAMEEEFNYNNYDVGRQKVLLELAKYLPDVGTAANWFARNFITTEQFREILQFNRWSQDEIDIATQAMFSPANSAEYTRFRSRKEASNQGFLSDSYGSNPPDDVNKVQRENQKSEEQAQLDWLAHWKDLGLYDYVNAYFRGLIDEDMFNKALGSLNIPSELNKLIQDVNRPLIPFFYLTEMLAAGIFTESEAENLLGQYGFNKDAITASIKFGNFKAIGKATDQNTALAQLSVSQLKTMFDDGIIDKTQLVLGLEEHGYNSEVAVLLSNLYETEQQLKDNKDYATMVIDRVKLGRLTKLEALDDLASRGYTQAQLTKYDLDIENIKTTSGKLPTKAEFDDFWKHGLISDSDYVTALQLLGYSDKYANLFLEYLNA